MSSWAMSGPARLDDDGNPDAPARGDGREFGMTWTLTGDLDEYLDTVSGFLRQAPIADTLLLTLTETMRTRGANAFSDRQVLLGWWRDDEGAISAALLQTPPFALILSRCPQAAVPDLVEVIGEYSAQAAQLNLPTEHEALFADVMAAKRGAIVEAQERNRLYRLGQITPPDPGPAGSDRPATSDDMELLVDWYLAFAADIGHETTRDPSAQIESRLASDGIRLWQLADGTSVSMAWISPEIAGMVRIGPVYTPAAHRGRGYGSAITAAISQGALDAGVRDVLLFTDLDNPTSNGIYQRLGYVEVTDRVILAW
jgi:predicted GNAT family acetyltransferase